MRQAPTHCLPPQLDRTECACHSHRPHGLYRQNSVNSQRLIMYRSDERNTTRYPWKGNACYQCKTNSKLVWQMVRKAPANHTRKGQRPANRPNTCTYARLSLALAYQLVSPMVSHPTPSEGGWWFREQTQPMAKKSMFSRIGTNMYTTNGTPSHRFTFPRENWRR